MDKFLWAYLAALTVVLLLPVAAALFSGDGRWILLFMFMWAMSPFVSVWILDRRDRRHP